MISLPDSDGLTGTTRSSSTTSSPASPASPAQHPSIRPRPHLRCCSKFELLLASGAAAVFPTFLNLFWAFTSATPPKRANHPIPPPH
ncbi:hypothetical protein SODALDRAFT_361303 [Sodiomyces alkalinus F11]|uniref:Uncharacterized protein n=1 Tax=Sodiomyces alkalinus (strain CBS 110278 / VKM F-3762 / F11) TaxID=1314773 RepID=A0A3N2PST9_SODAK|nr:hypothetical protein SODALDRAFT_361303 [Sodiomyces alkalinus F11]ROT37583.1 hypothetical protein SODALDRAFT_361303 [Sodiomyces alkalinus F11]